MTKIISYLNTHMLWISLLVTICVKTLRLSHDSRYKSFPSVSPTTTFILDEKFITLTISEEEDTYRVCFFMPSNRNRNKTHASLTFSLGTNFISAIMQINENPIRIHLSIFILIIPETFTYTMLQYNPLIPIKSQISIKD